jgi:hypothetical protein
MTGLLIKLKSTLTSYILFSLYLYLLLILLVLTACKSTSHVTTSTSYILNVCPSLINSPFWIIIHPPSKYIRPPSHPLKLSYKYIPPILFLSLLLLSSSYYYINIILYYHYYYFIILTYWIIPFQYYLLSRLSHHFFPYFHFLVFKMTSRII